MRSLALLFAFPLTLSAQTGRTFTYDCVGEPKLTLADSLVVLRVKRDTTRVSVTPCITRTKRDTVRDSVIVTPPKDSTPTLPAPTGWTLFSELGPTLPLTGGFRIAYDASSVTSAIDPSGQPSLAMRFPAGYEGGASPATIYYEGWNVPRLRFESRVSYATSYVRHPSGVDKQVFLNVGGYNSFFTMMYGAEHDAAVGLQGLASSYAVNCTVTPTEECRSVNLVQNMNQTVSTGRFVYGRSHRFDCEVTTGTTGTVNCWLDGVQIMSYSGVPFRAGGVQAVAYVPTWGGAGGTLLAAQYTYLGFLRVYR